MADFAASYEDWGLQAIVEGSSNFSMANNNHNNYFDDHHNLRLAFSELFGNQNSSMVMDSDGLESFYKPFYSISDSITAINVSDHEHVQKKIEIEEKLAEVKVQNQNHHHTDQSATIIEATKCKKSCRKNQRKRSMVVQVTADDFSSDKWAWRKYGQKPIKGSIYPRSYYKCSSMKACLARKQVEQSCSDPTKYIITYTAEHCHSHPTRRNSLAGTVRNRFPTPTNTIQPKSSNDVVIISPKSSLIESSTEEIISDGRQVKQERLDEDDDHDHEEQKVDEWGCNKEFSISDIVMNDEFFAALEDF